MFIGKVCLEYRNGGKFKDSPKLVFKAITCNKHILEIELEMRSNDGVPNICVYRLNKSCIPVD